MAGWGIMAGLGKGLETAGEMWSEKAKSEFAEKLAQAREERAEERQVKREERQAARAESTVAGYKPLRDESGVTWMQGYNAAGAPKGERRLANQQEIEEFNRQSQADKLTLEKLTSQAAIEDFKASRLEKEASMEDTISAARLRGIEADIGATNALRDQRNRKDDGPDDEKVTLSAEDVADALLSDNKSLVEQYGLTPSQANDLAMSAIRDGRASGQDPKSLFRKALPKFVDELRAKGHLGGKKKGSLELDL